jgi:hypothetical protein
MPDKRAHVTIACLTLTALQATAPESIAAPTASSAFGFDASFSAGKLMTHLGPLGSLSGSVPPGYSKTSIVGPIDKVFHITDSPAPTPTMTVAIDSIRTHVASAGILFASASAEADATVKGLDLSLMLYPPPPSPISPQPFLRVQAKEIKSTASMSEVFIAPVEPTATSAARFSGLVISGSLIGEQPIQLTGDVPNDTVVFQSPTVTVTLNQKIVAGLISCTPKCIFTPDFINGTALDIVLTDADLSGKTVSGEIAVGLSHAGSEPGLPLTARFSSGK